MTENTQETRGIQETTHSKVKVAIAVEVAAYVLVLVAGLGSTSLPLHDIPQLVILLLFMVYWPFRGTVLDRVVTIIFGLASLACAVFPFAERFMKQNGSSYQPQQWDFWALAAGALLVVLVIFSFARQMLREDRSHLIRALSHAVTSGVAAIAVAGWCFLPDLYALVMKGNVAAIVALVVIALLAVALGVASYFWVRDADPAPTALRPWIGIGLLPVMLMGVTIPVATLLINAFF